MGRLRRDRGRDDLVVENQTGLRRTADVYPDINGPFEGRDAGARARPNGRRRAANHRRW
jgi:hypothetical protein